MKTAMMIGMFFFGIAGAIAGRDHSPTMDILINGKPAPTYQHKGTTYIEAIQRKEYAVRLTNPLGIRVAVALAVDGLNTIDARHTEARLGQKWVLEPYESIVISGWQTNARQARRFFFTTEERSYGAKLNQMHNLGIISAVFFREKVHAPQPVLDSPGSSLPHGAVPAPDREQAPAAGKPANAEMKSMRSADAAEADPALSDYAATGIGDRIRHDVERIYLELENHPFATVNFRYEFRPALVRLGVIQPPYAGDPLARRERALGFRDSGFCPEP